MEEVVVAEETTEENALTETDEVSELSSEDIEAQLKDIESEETTEETETEPAQETETAIEEPKAEETSEETEEPSELEQENAALTEKLENQRKQMDRWGNEIGELRKLQEVVSKTRMTDEQFKEEFEENPQETLRRHDEHRDAETSIKEAESEVALISARNDNERDVRSIVPDIDDLVPDMIAVVKLKHNLSDEDIKPFENDIFAFEKHEILSLAQEVKAATLQTRLEEAQTELETVKKSKGGDMLKKIDKVAKKSASSVNAASGQAESSGGEIELSEETIDNMSIGQINKILKEKGIESY